MVNKADTRLHERLGVDGRLQERAQCHSPFTLTPAALHLCLYFQSPCRGSEVQPRSDCSDFVDHSKDATLGAQAQPLARMRPDYNLCHTYAGEKQHVQLQSA